MQVLFIYFVSRKYIVEVYNTGFDKMEIHKYKIKRASRIAVTTRNFLEGKNMHNKLFLFEQ